MHDSTSTTYVSGQLQARFGAWTLLGHFFQRRASSREAKNSTVYRVAVTIGSHDSFADVEAHRLERARIYICKPLISRALWYYVLLLPICCSRYSFDLSPLPGSGTLIGGFPENEVRDLYAFIDNLEGGNWRPRD